jgi:heme/copper-type cytochrome/quinol oxidase subunit 1
VSLTNRLSQPQKIVVIIALAAALLTLGSYLIGLGGDRTGSFGWYAYAPLNASQSAGGFIVGASTSFWQHGWVRLFIWLVLTAVWALAAVTLLRPPREAPSASQP